MAKKEKIKSENKEMPFLDHLEELRWHIIRSVLAVFILAIVAFLNKRIIFDGILLKPINPDFWTNRMFAKLADYTGSEMLRINATPLELISINITSQFNAHIKLSLIAGLIIAFPYIIYEIWRFISPALYENERKHSSGAVFFISILFFMGVFFSYYLITPLSMNFFSRYTISEVVTNQIHFMSYMSTVFSVTLASGILFELPVFVYFLSKVGLLTPDIMKHYRRHAIIVLLSISAIITPPDIFSQIMVCIPLMGLYELGIVISRRVERKREAAS